MRYIILIIFFSSNLFALALPSKLNKEKHLIKMPQDSHYYDFHHRFDLYYFKDKIEQKPYTVKVDGNDLLRFDDTTLIKYKIEKFVITEDERLLVFNNDYYKTKTRKVHSMLNSGNDVLAAGGILIEEGKILAFSNLSGHYKPPLRGIINTMKWINKNFRYFDTIIEFYTFPEKLFLFEYASNGFSVLNDCALPVIEINSNFSCYKKILRAV